MCRPGIWGRGKPRPLSFLILQEDRKRIILSFGDFPAQKKPTDAEALVGFLFKTHNNPERPPHATNFPNMPESAKGVNLLFLFLNCSQMKLPADSAWIYALVPVELFGKGVSLGDCLENLFGGAVTMRSLYGTAYNPGRNLLCHVSSNCRWFLALLMLEVDKLSSLEFKGD